MISLCCNKLQLISVNSFVGSREYLICCSCCKTYNKYKEMFNFFKKKPTSFLGIDIGTTNIKVVQFRLDGKNVRLENYAFLEDEDYLEALEDVSGSKDLKMSNTQIVKYLTEIKKEAKITSNNVIMSVPISSAFSSVINLPDISEDKIAKVINYEARKYIPIPINEVVFDWSIISEKDKSNNSDKKNKSKSKKRIKVLLVAIPKEITEKYSAIADASELKLIALETESFSLLRSLIKDEKGVFIIVDIRNKMTNVTVIENGYVLASHSVFGTGGREITKAISCGFNIDFKRADRLKKDIGLSFSGPQKKVSETILPTVNIIISEIKRMRETYIKDNKKTVKRVIVTGESANLPGLVKYFSSELNISVEIGDPWKNIVYDKILSRKLKRMSSNFSVAVGLALRGFEK